MIQTLQKEWTCLLYCDEQNSCIECIWTSKINYYINVLLCANVSCMIFTYNRPYCTVQVNIKLWILSLEYSYDANYNPVLRVVKNTYVNRTVSHLLNVLDFPWMYLWNYCLHWNNLQILSEFTLHSWTHSCLSAWLKEFTEN